ncbi:MAG: glycogen debranching protein GlgX [Pseudohongiellaceae bacterium]
MDKPTLTRERLLRGEPHPLGATCMEGGVNFALFSAHAEKVELCLFSPDGQHEISRLEMPAISNQVWHGFLPRAGAGTVYGYRVHGPYQPHLGHRFNPNKLLLDPYARQLLGDFIWSDAHYGFDVNDPDKDLVMDVRDNLSLMPKCVVTADLVETVAGRNRIRKSDTILYETHVKGFTMLHPAIPDAAKGTFAGLAHPTAIAHLKSLGITSVELLPVQSFISEAFLGKKGLSNYWGYNTLAFFAPHRAYLGGTNVLEFRHMVERLHDAGLEVILDIVFNHTAEGGRLGPTLSFKGIDNLSYYRLQSEDRRFYINDTGCGNTINILHPRVIQLIMDCLRYWVAVMQVDGFRFDLAPVLGREPHGFDRGAGFFDALLQDPILAGTKFIAEPWDIGPGGYQLGHFPVGWSEWNDRYRDTVRKYWRGDSGMLPELARRLHGSSDIFEHSGRRPSAAINYVTSHDGFTLADLVSYKDRHNEKNGEQNQDGHQENYSDNFGVEGLTTDTTINALRWRQQKNLLATLIFSQGTPMLSGGDEFGRSQSGNNNAYCQDNELNWIDWQNRSGHSDNQCRFLAHIIALRKRFPAFNLDHYIHEPETAVDPAIEWYNANGHLMQPNHWAEFHIRTLGYLLSWHDTGSNSRQRIFIVFHADRDASAFQLPVLQDVVQWEILFDTALATGIPEPGNCLVQSRLRLFSCSTVMLLARSSQQTINFNSSDQSGYE